MRRLPVIQPTALERRAFLLGLVGAVAACASEPGTEPRRTGTSGGPASTSPRADGGSPGVDGGDASTGPGGPSFDGGSDAGVDAAPGPGCAIAGVDVGAPGTFAMGTLTFIAAANAFIGRDAGGLYAMYSLCTHTIGNLQLSATQLTCLVHGARFSLTGAVLQGPATMPLPHFDLCLNAAGNVAVDTKVIVSSTTRLSA